MKREYSGFMSISKPRFSKLLAAARHNRRAIAAELRNTDRINPALSNGNIRLRGKDTPEDIKAEAQSLLAGLKPKTNNVIMEIVFSLPADTAIPLRDYFGHCTTWAEKHFGFHILSSDIHVDEANPHCHVLLLPLRDGKFNGSDAVGGKARLLAHQAAFHEQVGAAFGLPRRQPRLVGSAKKALAEAVLDQLKGARDAITKSAVWLVTQQAINDNPQPWAESLGLDVPESTKRRRGFTQIMTSPGKGPRQEQQPSPIGFGALNGCNPTSV